MVNPGLATLTSRAKFSETPPAEAVNRTVCGPPAGVTTAEKAALVAPAATITEDGTVTVALLLARFTEKPPSAAAAFNVTVHASVPEPIIELLLHASDVNVGAGAFTARPVPLRLITSVPLIAASLVTVNKPFAAPEVDGSNCTFTLYVPPVAASVMGRLFCPLSEKDCPVTFRLEICTGDVPRFTSDTLAVAVLPTDTDPKLTLPVDAWRVPGFDPASEDPPQPPRSSGSQDRMAISAHKRQPNICRLRERMHARA
jgi:hypothetical protein